MLETRIKPYYQDEWVTIYHGDCREILPELPKVDLVLTDPPYGVNLDLEGLNKLNIRQGKPQMRNYDKLVGDESKNAIDLSFLFDYPNRLIFGFPHIYDASATGWLVWDKQPFLDQPNSILTAPLEMASTTLWKGYRLIRCMWQGYFRDNGEYRYNHPTQKPQKVIDYGINKGSNPNDLILDPFLGSGTTAYCVKKLNRKCMGIEIEEKYCEIAAKRCSQGVFDLSVGGDGGC